MDVTLEPRGVVRVLRVDRPARRNALDPHALREIARLARAVRTDTTARALVLTGTGPLFIAGGDLHAFRNATGARVAELGHSAVRALHRVGLPLIAAVQGDAFGGGCELAAACDVRLVETHARFHWTQGRFAVTTGWGGTARLVDIVGAHTALEWLLSRAPVTAERALHAGFAHSVVPTGASLDHACAWAESHTHGDRAWLVAQTALVRSAARSERNRAKQNAKETQRFVACWANDAHTHAVESFLSRG